MANEDLILPIVSPMPCLWSPKLTNHGFCPTPVLGFGLGVDFVLPLAQGKQKQPSSKYFRMKCSVHQRARIWHKNQETIVTLTYMTYDIYTGGNFELEIV